MFKQSIKFFAVDDKAGGPPVIDLDSKAKNVDTYDLLGEDDETLDLEEKREERKIKEKDTPKEEDTDIPEGEEEPKVEDELEALEEELEEPDEEKLELVTPVRRRDILAKYPKLFQEFPYLEKAYYREQQFTEIYPTIDDAKAAHEKASALDKFEGELMSGNTEGILRAVKAEDENAFHQVVDNYLTALFNTDQSAYFHVLGNINRMTIAQMVNEGKNSKNDELIAAASVLQQYVFGTQTWTPPARLAKNVSPEKKTVDSERDKFLQERYEIARDDLQVSLENVFRATIEQHIDPKGVMTSYVKNAAVTDALKGLQKGINGDARFQSIQKKMWSAAGDSKFDRPSIERIKSAFKSKAKILLPTVIKQARNEALRGLGKRVKDDTNDENDGTTRSSRPTNRNTSSSSSTGRTHSERAKAIPKNMTTLEFLNQE